MYKTQFTSQLQLADHISQALKPARFGYRITYEREPKMYKPTTDASSNSKSSPTHASAAIGKPSRPPSSSATTPLGNPPSPTLLSSNTIPAPSTIITATSKPSTPTHPNSISKPTPTKIPQSNTAITSTVTSSSATNSVTSSPSSAPPPPHSDHRQDSLGIPPEHQLRFRSYKLTNIRAIDLGSNPIYLDDEWFQRTIIDNPDT